MALLLERKNYLLLWDLTKRDLKLRFLGSMLGSTWHIIHPLVMILIYTLVFSNVMKARLANDTGMFSYGLYLCSGILAWGAFTDTLQRSVQVFLDHAGFIKKIAFPPLILFGSTYLSVLVNFLFSYVLFLGFSIYADRFSVAGAFLGLIVALLFNLFALGIGICLSCLNVFLRDVQQMLTVVMQLWFWTTPIVYLENSLPEFAAGIIKLNPAYYYIRSLHDLLYFQSFPSLTCWGLMLAMSSMALVLGFHFYRQSISLVRDEI